MLAAIAAVDSFSYALVLPVLPFELRSMGAGAVLVAAVFAAFSACQFVAAPVLGRASDRWGRRRVLLVSQAGTLAGFVVLFLARSPGQVLAARVIDGATAGNLAVVYATLCDLYAAEERAPRFAMLNTAAGIGILAGLGVCAALTTRGFATLAAVAASAALVTIAGSLVVTFPPPSGAVDRARWGRLLIGAPVSLRRSGMVVVAVQVHLGAFAVTLPALLHATIDASARSGIVVAAVGLVVGIAAQVTAGVRLNRRLGDRLAAAAALGGVEAGVLLLGVGTGRGPLVGLVLSGAGAALVAAGLLSALTATSWLSTSAALGAGLLMGLSQALASVGQLIGPALGFVALAAASWVLLGLLASLGVVGIAACRPLRRTVS
ncbi:MAG: MFS transporter [Actinomycetota bacterium]|nr:MFS transporter [Actinomycetota bacterium]